jgi:hypothetical protein
MGLIGKEMFAVDGCKLPSNASKEWSGTKGDLEKKKGKMEKAIRQIMKRHREVDAREADKAVIEQEEQYVETLRGKVKKIKAWLRENDDKPGKSGKPLKSNITDNESAKMKTSHGVIQGYDGVAVIDGKHQVVVHAEAFGAAQEHDLLIPMIEGARENFEAIGNKRDVFKEAKLTADSGFHTEANMKEVMEQGIDAYIADTGFRKRDPRFSEVDCIRTTNLLRYLTAPRDIVTFAVIPLFLRVTEKLRHRKGRGRLTTLFKKARVAPKTLPTASPPA